MKLYQSLVLYRYSARRSRTEAVDLHILQIRFEPVDIAYLAYDLSDLTFRSLLSCLLNGDITYFAVFSREPYVGGLGVVRQCHYDINGPHMIRHNDRNMILISLCGDPVLIFFKRRIQRIFPYFDFHISRARGDIVSVKPGLTVFEIAVSLDRLVIVVDMFVIGVKEDNGRGRAGILFGGHLSAEEMNDLLIFCHVNAAGYVFTIIFACDLAFDRRSIVIIFFALFLIHDADHDIRKMRVKLLPGHLYEFLPYSLISKRLSEPLLSRHRIISVGNRDYP